MTLSHKFAGGRSKSFRQCQAARSSCNLESQLFLGFYHVFNITCQAGAYHQYITHLMRPHHKNVPASAHIHFFAIRPNLNQYNVLNTNRQIQPRFPPGGYQLALDGFRPQYLRSRGRQQSILPIPKHLLSSHSRGWMKGV